MIRLVWAIEGLKSTDGIVEKSRDLGQVYDDGPSVALEAAAIALGEVPDQGAAFGPAVRDPTKRPPPGAVFESILTDIRDFLKLRFRAEGMADPDGTLAGRGRVAASAPRGASDASHVPGGVGGAAHGGVRLTIPVVVAGNRHVVPATPTDIGDVAYVPRAVGRMPHPAHIRRPRGAGAWCWWPVRGEAQTAVAPRWQ